MPTSGGTLSLPPEVQTKLQEIDETRQLVLEAQASDALMAAQTNTSITTLAEAIDALNALSDSYEAALPASIADRQELHARDEAFAAMVADMQRVLEAANALDQEQTAELEVYEADLLEMASQVQDFLTRPAPKRYAVRVQTDSAGTATVTFPTGLFSTVPVVTLTAESVASVPLQAVLIGTPTPLGCSLKVYRAMVSVNFVGATNLKLLDTPGVVWVNLSAQEAS